MAQSAAQLFGSDYRWSTLGAGASRLRIAAQSTTLSCNVGVGIEGSLWVGKGRLATSGADQVRLVRGIMEGLGLEIAAPGEARVVLSLRGADWVAF